MWDFLSTVPHCALFGKPMLAFFHVAGDLLTGTAYMAIPATMEYVRRKRAIPLNRIAACFALFIFFCGAGHFLHILTTFTAAPWAYWWLGINNMLTGIVSWATALYLLTLVPTLLRMPTIEQHDNAVAALEIMYRWLGKIDMSKMPEAPPRWPGITED